MRQLVLNAAQLLTLAGSERPRRGAELSALGLIRDGAVLIEDGVVLAAGLRDVVQSHDKAGSARLVDCGGRVVAPGFVDSHTHPVFVEPRLADFEARLKGKSYAELAAAGGGILSTAAGVRAASVETLAAGLRRRAQAFLECGTTTIEAKSGYGLDLESELKILRAIRLAAASSSLEIVPTLLGAHALPAGVAREAFLAEVTGALIPAAAREGLARFVDAFCDKGFFTVAETEAVLAAGAKAGLRAKVHAEQLSRSGSVAPALRAGAVSLDHLDCADAADMAALAASDAVAVLVPGSNYFLGKPYPPARALIGAGAAVALATDFNPGTCPCWDMRQVLSIACAQMKMTPAETIVAATVNGAHALGLGATHGVIAPGRRADLVCWEAADYREIPYYFGGSSAAWTMKGGVVVHSREGPRL